MNKLFFKNIISKNLKKAKLKFFYFIVFLLFNSCAKDRYIPDTSATWQWQLTGNLNTSYKVNIYDIDLFETPKETIDLLHQKNKKVICYFSAGSYESWREDADRFPNNILGKELDGWSEEKWLDIRDSNLRTIMKSRLDLAIEKGCDCVEPDNVDGYINDSGFALTAEDQLKYNKFLAEEAHTRGLCIGLKNDLDQIDDLVNSFDFSINEQCHEFNECEKLYPFINANKAVLNAEYKQTYVDNTNGERDVLCETAKKQKIKTLILPLDLDDSFRLSCD